MERVIIVGSPRAKGRCAALAAEIFDACIEDCPDDGVAIAPVSTLDVAPCIGCDACAAEPECPAGGEAEKKQGRAKDAAPELRYGRDAAACAIADDMAEVRELLDAADEVIVVAPLYFSGPPAPFKALIDRLQPYYWARERLLGRGEALPRKRPLTLHIVGEGGDPHGFTPMVGIVRSAFACADFELVAVYDWVAKIDATGEITADADDVTALFLGEPVHSGDAVECGERPRASGADDVRDVSPDTSARRGKRGKPHG